MVATTNPFGIRPAYCPSGKSQAVGIVGGIASGYASNVLKYQPVSLNSSGNIIQASNTGDFYGVFAGITWVDAQGVPHSSDMWTASTVYTPTLGASPIYAWVWNDPTIVYSIQCDGSLAQSTSIGAQLNFSNITAGSTTTGLSACTANASTVTTSGQNQLRIVALDPQIGNAWGDSFTVVQVQMAQSQFVANKVAV